MPDLPARAPFPASSLEPAPPATPHSPSRVFSFQQDLLPRPALGCPSPSSWADRVNCLNQAKHQPLCGGHKRLLSQERVTASLNASCSLDLSSQCRNYPSHPTSVPQSSAPCLVRGRCFTKLVHMEGKPYVANTTWIEKTRIQTLALRSSTREMVAKSAGCPASWLLIH